MSKLGFLDQMFYQMELNGSSAMVMGGAMIFDPSTSPYSLDAKMFASHLAARMEIIPLMRKKVVRDILKVGSFRLVDDPDFRVGDHITLTKLKKPGGYTELVEYLGKFSGERLNLDKPLWHYEVIEGLEGGRIGLATHIHHALLDGIGAMQTLQTIFDMKPVPADTPKKGRWDAPDGPTPQQLLGSAIAEVARNLYVEGPKFVLQTNMRLAAAASKKLQQYFDKDKASAEAIAAPDKLPKVRKLSFNASPIDDKRSVAYVNFPLEKIKAIKNRYRCTINDVVLLINSFALDYYLQATGEAVDCDLIALMPINTRTADQGSEGNAWGVARVNLHNRMDKIETRLGAIVMDTQALKQSPKDKTPVLDGLGLMGIVSPGVLDPLLATAMRFNLLAKLPIANIVVTNVPGAAVPIYIAGARQVEMIPLAPTLEMVGLTATVTSADSALAIGFHGYGDAISDIELFAHGARKCYEQLVDRISSPSSAH